MLLAEHGFRPSASRGAHSAEDDLLSARARSRSPSLPTDIAEVQLDDVLTKQRAVPRQRSLVFIAAVVRREFLVPTTPMAESRTKKLWPWDRHLCRFTVRGLWERWLHSNSGYLTCRRGIDGTEIGVYAVTTVWSFLEVYLPPSPWGGSLQQLAKASLRNILSRTSWRAP